MSKGTNERERDIMSPTDIIIMQLVYFGSHMEIAEMRDHIDKIQPQYLGILAMRLNEYLADMRESDHVSDSLISVLEHALAETIDRMAFIINPLKDADEPF